MYSIGQFGQGQYAVKSRSNLDATHGSFVGVLHRGRPLNMLHVLSSLTEEIVHSAQNSYAT